MTHPLVLDLPEEVYQPLIQTAQATGVAPEQLAVEWLAAVCQRAVEDPLERLIGALPANVPDWADQHDKYLGQALMRELGGKSEAGS
jgi:hypothetical protein